MEAEESRFHKENIRDYEESQIPESTQCSEEKQRAEDAASQERKPLYEGCRVTKQESENLIKSLITPHHFTDVAIAELISLILQLLLNFIAQYVAICRFTKEANWKDLEGPSVELKIR
ncbi:uncharacterized protein LOC117179642 [Belonocnema kinseyi]|uniref:uncharacterized protein LOC117179642 n=1 Tax=Belonocnema kinseyi TaxID=2817044 RepID=UPI00143D0C8D|nr:uncharacterized protein LOC117179642 [Belonocnema kinseyi]